MIDESYLKSSFEKMGCCCCCYVSCLYGFFFFISLLLTDFMLQPENNMFDVIKIKSTCSPSTTTLVKDTLTGMQDALCLFLWFNGCLMCRTKLTTGKNNKVQKCMQYLMGAPLAWAGLSKTVMVVAVSFRKASDPSYSSIVGAAEQMCVKLNLRTFDCEEK